MKRRHLIREGRSLPFLAAGPAVRLRGLSGRMDSDGAAWKADTQRTVRVSGHGQRGLIPLVGLAPGHHPTIQAMPRRLPREIGRATNGLRRKTLRP